MVTTTFGTAVFKGRATGKTYSVDFYIADVIGTAIKFDSGSGASATSNPYWIVPENCDLVDVSVVTGPTVMTNLILTSNGAPLPQQRLRISTFLTTLATRPTIKIGFAAGRQFGMIEA